MSDLFKDWIMEITLDLKKLHYTMNYTRVRDYIKAIKNELSVRKLEGDKTYRLRMPRIHYEELYNLTYDRPISEAKLIVRCRENDKEFQALLNGEAWGSTRVPLSKQVVLKIPLPQMETAAYLSQARDAILAILQEYRCSLKLNMLDDHDATLIITGPYSDVTMAEKQLRDIYTLILSTCLVFHMQIKHHDIKEFIDMVYESLNPIAVLSTGKEAIGVFNIGQYDSAGHLSDMTSIMLSEHIDEHIIKQLEALFNELISTQTGPSRERRNSLPKIKKSNIQERKPSHKSERITPPSKSEKATTSGRQPSRTSQAHDPFKEAHKITTQNQTNVNAHGELDREHAPLASAKAQSNTGKLQDAYNEMKNENLTNVFVHKGSNVKVVCCRGRNNKLDVGCLVKAITESYVEIGGIQHAEAKARGREIPKQLVKIVGGTHESHADADVTVSADQSGRMVLSVTWALRHRGKMDEREVENAYSRCLCKAQLLNQKSLGFPLLGSGLYGWTTEEAAQVACRAIHTFCSKDITEKSKLKEVHFVEPHTDAAPAFATAFQPYIDNGSFVQEQC